ncbi:hypothetical protein [Sneathiella glossodoripedis]|uniref:hypothetical protein n=1 Tax=Sneathiella glossodoripedis TaxID=418853 RepID=UPI000472650A|nr:hypothetical protein [Sneathiella glossodoripedis]
MSTSLQLALDYPYERPSYSYTLHNGVINHGVPLHEIKDRIPVIASGSNAAPAQLLRKFSNNPSPIYVTRATLGDFTSVYSAHFTSYGSVPATLAYKPGIKTLCHITWLTEDHLTAMHETEALGINYRYSILRSLNLECSVAGPLKSAGAYISLHGGLCYDGAMLGLSEFLPEIQKVNINWLDQSALQLLLLEILQVNIPLEDFIVENISNSQVRKQRTQKLKQIAIAFDYPNEDIILDHPLG